MRFFIPLLLLAGCCGSAQDGVVPKTIPENMKRSAQNVYKFYEGENVCYIYMSYGISCVRHYGR